MDDVFNEACSLGYVLKVGMMIFQTLELITVVKNIVQSKDRLGIGSDFYMGCGNMENSVINLSVRQVEVL